MRYILILNLINFSNCTYYFYKDPTPYLLTEQEKQIFNSKKILYIGFDYVGYEDFKPDDERFKEDTVTNKDHLRIIEFLNNDYHSLDKFKNSFKIKLKAVRSRKQTISDGVLKKGTEFSSFGLNESKLIEFEKGINKNINDKNLQLFLHNYLKNTKQLGLDKMNSTLDTRGNQIKLKLKNFDYILVGVGKLDDQKRISPNILSIILFTYTLGIFPITIRKAYSTNLYLFDEKLNLVKELEKNDQVLTFISSIIFFPNNGSKSFEKDIAQFLKDSVKEIK